MTRTEQITNQVCDRHGINPQYPLADVLIDDPKLAKLYRRSGIALKIVMGAVVLDFAFWIIATAVSLL